MPKLQLSDVRKKMPFHINYGLSAFTMRDLLDRGHYDLDFDVYLPSKKMNLQRPFCWTLGQKQELIMSLLKGLNISQISCKYATNNLKELANTRSQIICE